MPDLKKLTPNICCIGHITLDKIITPRQTVYLPGGTSYYFAHAFSHLGHSGFRLVTSLAEREMATVDDIRNLGIDVSVIPSNETVYFENIYSGNQNERKQRVLAKATPFSVECLKDVKAYVFHLGGLLADDFSLEVIKFLATRGRISVDVQGYLREVRGKDVFAVDWTEKHEALKYIDILKANEKEMQVITGCQDPYDAALKLSLWGVKEVVLTFGSEGSLIYAEGNFHKIPAYPPQETVDATGCGDTYMAGYLYSRSHGASYDEAGRFAAAMCTLKLTHSGPFNSNEEDVCHLCGVRIKGQTDIRQMEQQRQPTSL